MNRNFLHMRLCHIEHGFLQFSFIFFNLEKYAGN